MKAQKVLHDQLAFLETLPQSLQVHMPIFLSNRIWLIREGIEFSPLPAEPPRPRMVLHRTQTRVPLPAPDGTKAGLPWALEAEWRKRGLLEL